MVGAIGCSVARAQRDCNIWAVLGRDPCEASRMPASNACSTRTTEADLSGIQKERAGRRSCWCESRDPTNPLPLLPENWCEKILSCLPLPVVSDKPAAIIRGNYDEQVEAALQAGGAQTRRRRLLTWSR